MTNPKDQDVAALVARLKAHVEDRGGMSRDAESGELVLPNGAWAMMLEAATALLASEARATALEAQLWDMRKRHAVLYDALMPFAKAADIRLCGGDDHWTDDKRIQSTDIASHITFGHLRAAREALRSPAPADGRGNQMLASASCPQEPIARRVRHKKRGTTYEVLGEAEAQISSGTIKFLIGGDDPNPVGRRLVEGGTLTVYRCEKTGKLWLRFPDEFEDGRFEDIPAPPVGSLANLADATPIEPPTEPGADADDIRAQGWAVAVHNDYRLNGENHTFWLFTKGSACVKGEGRTDAEALDAIRSALTLPSSTAQTGDA